MDIARPQNPKAKLRKRVMIGSAIVIVLVAATFSLSRLKPAAPSVDRNQVWIGTVKRGPMVRQVRGIGTLVPEDISWIAARTAGRVDRIVIRPGAIVKSDSVIVELRNPDVEQAADAADSQLKAAEAELENLKVQLERGVLEQESEAARAKSDYEQAKLRAEVNEDLFKDGLVSPLELRLSRVTAEESATRNDIEQSATFSKKIPSPRSSPLKSPRSTGYAPKRNCAMKIATPSPSEPAWSACSNSCPWKSVNKCSPARTWPASRTRRI